MKKTVDYDPNKYRRDYLHRHPEVALRWRVTAAVNLLCRVGAVEDLLEALQRNGVTLPCVGGGDR